VLGTWALIALAQPAAPEPPPRPPGQDLPPAAQATPGREMTVTGRVVDVHGFLTGDYPSEDKAKCTADNLKNGVPPALETNDGLVIVSQGQRSAAPALVPLAFQQVEAKGKFFQKDGIRYLDIASIEAAGGSAKNDEQGRPPAPSGR